MSAVGSGNAPIFSVLIRVSEYLESLVKLLANIFCWSYAFLIAVILVNVIMRYGFSSGLIVFEEIQWHLYAIGMMFGLSYAEVTNSQVRVDIVADMLKRRTVIKWEIFGAVVFVIPFIFVIVFNAWEYVENSYAINESSNSPLGLPYRWLIKAVIPASFLLLLCAVLARLIRNVVALTNNGDVK
ncbi:MAG: TRAP transporter small permease subunit [Cellvibrionaceae bacterium]